jgi:hypothetical protein
MLAAFGAPDTDIEREAIQSLPYATLSAKIGRGPRSLLVLGKKENGLEHWFSADQALLVIENGRIVQTAGFPDNLLKTVKNGNDPLNRLLHLAEYGSDRNKLEYVRKLDLSAENRFGVPVRSQFETIGHREIVIADIKVKTILVQELNTAFSINWSFKNHFWVDVYDGYIWKSRQHISRSFPPIDIEILKPAS